MRELADIALLRTFIAVAETASFTDGARRLRLTRSAAGKAIGRLEELLGARLFHRTTRRVGLTADGQAFYERAAQIVRDLEDAQAAVGPGRGEPRGTLRITAPEAFGRQKVLPVVRDFMRQWPALRVEISFTDRVVDLVEDGFDLAIRLGTVSASADLISRVVMRTVAKLAASPDYLAVHGVPATPEDLAGHRQLVSGNNKGVHVWRLVSADAREFQLPMNPTLLADSAGALLDAALSGLGVICLPRFLLEGDVAAGRLHIVLPDYATPEIPVSVVYPSRRHLSPRVRRFVDALAGALDRT